MLASHVVTLVVLLISCMPSKVGPSCPQSRTDAILPGSSSYCMWMPWSPLALHVLALGYSVCVRVNGLGLHIQVA
eukprot:4069746-Amphidinium_carterae.1